MQQRQDLKTTSVSRPEGYIDTESEISKKMKSALAGPKEIIVAGTKVAKKETKQAQESAAESRQKWTERRYQEWVTLQ